tara:strand:+ start:3362 stop:3631 length:270 start_codon:yes stop_codon:yes gene_type:complete
MKKELIKKFYEENKIELLNKLNIKFNDNWDVYFFDNGMCTFDYLGNDDDGVDISLIEGVCVEDEYNEVEKVKIGGKILFINDYRFVGLN